MWIGGPWRTVRPAAGRRNKNHGEERKNDPDLSHFGRRGADVTNREMSADEATRLWAEKLGMRPEHPLEPTPRSR